MKLTFNTKDIIKELEQALKTYDKKYFESFQIYSEKLQKYAKYIEHAVKDKENLEELKNAPSRPYYNGSIYEDRLSALKSHIGIYVDMSDAEYNDLKKGIQSLDREVTISMNSLAMLEY